MIRVGMTINLNDFQSEKIDIEFPSQMLPSNLTDPDAALEYASTWLNEKLRARIESIVRREAARGNRIDAPIVGPPERLTPPAVVQTPPPTLPSGGMVIR